jgi:DNA-binding beta-propeller fold protein YncE
VDAAYNVYVADTGGNTVRMVRPDGTVSILAGLLGSTGSSDGIGFAARFNSPTGIGIDSSGNVIVADTFNYTIRRGVFDDGHAIIKAQP